MNKKTKIVATISDLNCDVSFLKGLYDAGVNVMRLNTAHQKLDDSKVIIKNIRSVSDKIAIIIDTKGPEVRTRDIQFDMPVKRGDLVTFKDGSDDVVEGIVYVNYEGFVKDVSVKSKIFLDDAKIELVVKENKNNSLICEVLNDGIIKNKKSVNVPGIHLNYPSLIPKDIEYIEYAAKNDIDFIAHSFVRNKDDVLGVKKIIDKYKGKTKIIVKIENQDGIDNIDEILDEAYGVMVARGDLAVEIPIERVPLAQKKLIDVCIKRKRPVIVATQMMQSMVENPRPTRAEVSDVANAIRMGTDAIMTSDETTVGKYPIETIKMMSKIAVEVEKEFDERINDLPPTKNDSEIPVYLARAAVKSTLKLPVKAIVVDTQTGRSARYLSSIRGSKPIFAQCYDETVMRQLTLSYGVYVSSMMKTDDMQKFIGVALESLLNTKEFKKEDLVVILAGSFGPSHGASFIEISSISNLLGVSKKK